MSQKNRQGVLRSRPKGLVADGDIELIETELPELVGGEALVKTTLVGIDAAARTWLDDQPGYLPPVQVGEVVRAATVGEVVATRLLDLARRCVHHGDGPGECRHRRCGPRGAAGALRIHRRNGVLRDV